MASLSAAPTASASSSSSLASELEAAASDAAEPGVGGGGGVGGGDDLDSLLSNLSGQMDDVDDENMGARGKCAKCKQAIAGEVMQALGKAWHPHHFSCGSCDKPLGTEDFYEQDGVPHCTPCFQRQFSPMCAHCNEPVMDRCVTALGKKWHPEHFVCQTCLKGFDTGQFFEHGGVPYCEACFYEAHAPKCIGCGKGIKGDAVNAMGGSFHPECFCCTYCQKSFAGGTFFESGGKPYCETHYHQQAGALCAGCGKAITGRSVSALGKKFHPEHLVCSFCMNPLAGGSFSEKGDKVYCKLCFSKLFS
mmetsp:Transcript_14350/g.35513  ORF Transcript_14350/g.35513 Transcript_14350/m.35513 type:complete len:305 (-) Transcript_14350:127-1041(-)